MKPKLAAAVAVSASLLTAASGAAAPYRTAVLQGLDKVTARVSTIVAPIGAAIRFGALEVIVRHCDKRPPEEPPESAAFMDIWEVRPGEAAISLYRGWMFASSPALSALEHPVYDIWVLDCAGEVVSGNGSNAPSPGRDGKATELPDIKKLFRSKN